MFLVHLFWISLHFSQPDWLTTVMKLNEFKFLKFPSERGSCEPSGWELQQTIQTSTPCHGLYCMHPQVLSFLSYCNQPQMLHVWNIYQHMSPQKILKCRQGGKPNFIKHPHVITILMAAMLTIPGPKKNSSSVDVEGPTAFLESVTKISKVPDWPQGCHFSHPSVSRNRLRT